VHKLAGPCRSDQINGADVVENRGYDLKHAEVVFGTVANMEAVEKQEEAELGDGPVPAITVHVGDCPKYHFGMLSSICFVPTPDSFQLVYPPSVRHTVAREIHS
jgi:hypothetical protein